MRAPLLAPALGLVLAACVGAQSSPPELGALADRARLNGPVSAWCRGEFRAGLPAAFAVAVMAHAGGRYLILDRDGTVAELAAFTGKPDLACYRGAEVDRLNDALRESGTVEGSVSPRWPTAVVCGFIDATTAVCWQHSPPDDAYVRVGGWTT